uniref:RAB44 protein n=1 Tax=Syphacia muris TaxID=451379 RepID=A0A0N5AKQ6_9BILA
LDRIFKVVFVGDSAVGKTCFLHRFCHNRFKPLFNATIGVDFTVKTIKVKDKIVAVQLWDTAGQERFRSITKQYFRKADGVIVMYDVTSEQSYLNVRNWITSVQAGVGDNCILCLVGNKDYGMLFFETSAYTGYNVKECMKEVAEKLQQKEDDHLIEALKLEALENSSKKSWCCL